MDGRHSTYRDLRCLVALTLLLVLWQGHVAPLRARPNASPAFGIIRNDAHSVSIRWEPESAAIVTRSALRLTTAGSPLRSKTLPLRPGHLYAIDATMRRGPGTRDRFSLVFSDGAGHRQSWSPVWQFPTSTRPNWIPLSPSLQSYVQSFVMPPDAHGAHFEIALEPSDPQLAAYSALELTRLELVDQQKIPARGELGLNRLFGGDMETVAANGLPAGWAHWQPDTSKTQLVEVEGAPSGHQVLRVSAGTRALLSANDVAVTRATAWRISLWARGRGQLRVMAHSLSDDRPVPRRIGDPQARTFTLDTPSWQQLDQSWFAEAPAIQSAQVVIVVMATSDVDLDSVEFRPYRLEADMKAK